MTAWIHTGRLGPKPGTTEHDIALKQIRQPSGASRTRKNRDIENGPRTGHLTIIDSNGRTTSRTQTRREVAATVRKGQRNAQTLGETNRTFTRGRNTVT